MLLQVGNEGGYCGSLLTYGYIDTVYGLAGIVEALLVDDGVDGNGCLSSLAVADDKLTLASADRNHGVDGLQSGLQRLLYRLAVDYSWGLAVERHLE